MKRTNSTLLACLALLAMHAFLFAGLLHGAEESSLPLRADLCLNGHWEIAPGDDQMTMPNSGWTHARVPTLPITDRHTKAQWYRLSFEVPQNWTVSGRHFYLELEKAGHYAAVFCNGQKLGEHYGQYTPFETDLTAAFQPGDRNELAIYVHEASGRFVRPDANVTDPMVCNAYRPAAEETEQRNWIGLVGDLTLSFRPATQVADVFVETSVRQKSLQAHVTVARREATAGQWSCAGAVLDGEKVLLRLGPQPVAENGDGVLLSTPWSDPVLWGSPPYGEPKLYTLRVELLRDGKVADRAFTRFGFREVWLQGRDVLLNGKKLWLAGTYHAKQSPLRYLNDRRPMGATVEMMQAGGLNTLHGHWDDLGRTWLEVCDENGMFVLGAFFCDGRPKIQSSADEGWIAWMTQTCSDWVLARRNHPSILLWRPVDVLPPKLDQFMPRDQFVAKLGDVVRQHDPAHRPLADSSPSTDVVAWGQPPGNKDNSKLDNLAPLQNAARNTTKPILCKEIYGGFADIPGMLQFFRSYYETSFALRSTGIIVQHLPLLTWSARPPYAIQWLSQSGPGNRQQAVSSLAAVSPNWCDPSKRAWNLSAYGREFAQLLKQYLQSDLRPTAAGVRPEVLVSGLRPGSWVWLVPADPTLANPVGMLAAADGTAWFVAPQAGRWRLGHERGEKVIELKPLSEIPAPGYAHVQRVNAAE